MNGKTFEKKCMLGFFSRMLLFSGVYNGLCGFCNKLII